VSSIKTVLLVIFGFIGTIATMLLKVKKLKSEVDSLKKENENLQAEKESAQLAEKMMEEYVELKNKTSQIEKNELNGAKKKILQVDKKIEKANDEEDITITL